MNSNAEKIWIKALPAYPGHYQLLKSLIASAFRAPCQHNLGSPEPNNTTYSIANKKVQFDKISDKIVRIWGVTHHTHLCADGFYMHC